MRGFSNQNGVELRVEIQGERWCQGDRIHIEIEGKSPNTLYLALASGLEKKIKAKSEDAFQILQSNSADGQKLSCQFELSSDCRITDRTGSLYVLYGVGNPPVQPSSLRLHIEPHLHLKDWMDVITHQFRFSLKSMAMSKKNEIEFKLEAPQGREWASLEGLSVFLKISEGALQSRFHFQRKEINALKTALTTETVNRSFERAVALKEIVHDFNQRLNKDQVFALFESVITEYRSQSNLFS